MRYRSLFILALGVGLLGAARPARAILPSLGLYGGLSHSLSGDYDSWAGRANLYFAWLPGVSVGPEVGGYDFRRNDTQPACDTCAPQGWRRVSSYGLALRVGVPLPSFHPYLVGGVGSYRWRGYGQPDAQGLGMSGGVGLDLGAPLNFVNLAFEARWHGRATTHPTWDGWRNFYTLMAGLRFQLL